MFPQNEITTEAALRDLAHADQRVRERAASALGTVGPEDRERAITALRGALKDDIGAVRYAAALSLGELRDTGSIGQLVDQLEDGDPMARQAAAIALGAIGDKAAFEPLERAYRSGPADVRFQAITSLAELDPQRAFPVLVRALEDDDPEVRCAAAGGLGDEGDQRARDPLAKLLADTHVSCRFEAAYALARLGDRRAIPTLIDLVPEGDYGLLAWQGLTMLRAKEATGQARRTLRRFFKPEMQRVGAAALLAALGDDEGRAFVKKRLSHRREEVRAFALYSLGTIGDEWALGLLRELRAGTSDEDLVESIDEAMGRALRGREA